MFKLGFVTVVSFTSFVHFVNFILDIYLCFSYNLLIILNKDILLLLFFLNKQSDNYAEGNSLIIIYNLL